MSITSEDGYQILALCSVSQNKDKENLSVVYFCAFNGVQGKRVTDFEVKPSSLM